MNKLYSIAVYALSAIAVFFASCDPDAKWVTEDVEIKIRIERASAGFAVCEFTTNKEAYYLIAIEEVRPGYNPMDHQKAFMSMALDSAYASYLLWRNELWQRDEFNVAPFASHSLQYGNEYYTFTGLKPDTEYWIYAFVVDPVAMKPVGPLVLKNVQTSLYSDIQVQFEYRVKGNWDYTYPMDDYGNIDNDFPYLAITCDSLELVEANQTPEVYFAYWYADQFAHPEEANILFGVKAVNNNGYSSRLAFQKGHTYYTTIAGFDGPINHMVTYKFTWTGENFQYYYTEDADALIVDGYDEEIMLPNSNE